MSKLVKSLEFAALEKSLKGVRDLVLIAPNKVDSLLDFTFRKNLRDKKVAVKMVKNTLARKILEANGVKIDLKDWSGTTLVAWGADSVKELSKAVDGVIKDIEKNPKSKQKFVVKTAVADGQPVPMDLAMKMPTRLEAIGEIIGMILGPASSIAGALTGPASQVASQIATIADKKPEEAAAPAA